jgi:ABC-type multidrug transport system ATPase subunit
MPPAPLIELRALGKRYAPWRGSPVVALDDLSLDVHPGEVLGVAGPNGAGKSTLISILLGYVQPSAGEARIDGMPPRAYIERHGVGYLSELVDVEPRWSVREALLRFGTLAGVREGDLPLRVDELLERLGLAEYATRRFRELSKGNKQRLGLAQALLRRERVLILDEPTHGLDPVWLMRFRGIVAELRRPGRAILVASHNLEELERLCDRVAILDRGRLQRVVEVTRVLPQVRDTLFRLTIARGAELLPTAFPDALDLGRGDWAVRAPSLGALNDGIATLIARGVLVAGLAPAQSALEQEFHEAVTEVAA